MCLTLKSNIRESLTFKATSPLNPKVVKVYKAYYRTASQDDRSKGFQVKCMHQPLRPFLQKDRPLISSREVYTDFNGFENRLAQNELRRGEVHVGFHAWITDRNIISTVTGKNKKKIKRTYTTGIVIVEFEGHIDHFIAAGCDEEYAFSRLTPKRIVGYSTIGSTILRPPTKEMQKLFNGPKKKT